MKQISLAFIMLLLASCALQKKKVTLQVTYSEQYCGGARPSEEMQAQSEKNKPYPNHTLVFVSEKGKIDSARTTNNGELTIKLRKGTYSVIEAWRFNLYTPEDLPIDAFDRECLKQEWVREYGKLVLDKKTEVFTRLNPIVKFCAWRAPCLLQQEVPPGR
jgi:hypothetical protein